MPIFRSSDFTEAQLRSLAAHVKHRTFQPGFKLIEQGAVGTKFYLLQEGEVVVLKDGEQVARLRKGTY